MAWYELLFLCFFLCAFLVLLFASAYWEFQKYKKAMQMMDEQKEFYIWGKHFFICEMEEQAYEDVT